jgi:hypothetical protein
MTNLKIAALVALVALNFACASRQAEKPVIVSRAEWGSKPQPIPESRQHTPKYITVHHAGVLWTAKVTPDQFIRNMQTWGQRDKHWPDLPYHFLIAPDGRIFEGRSLAYEPESNTNYPLAGNIGVEMMGDFNKQRPSNEQIQSCVKLVAWLAQEYHINPNLKVQSPAGPNAKETVTVYAVRGHKDAAQKQTNCPGRDFNRYLDSGEFRNWVTQTLRGEHPDVRMGPPLPDGPMTSITATTAPSP